MKFIYLGEIVNTHGIKGELRILSDFKYKKKAFVIGQKFYVGKRKQELEIHSYRVHKNFDMVTFVGIKDINEAIAYKGDSVYVKRSDLNVDGYFNEDIIGLTAVAEGKKIGIVETIMKNNAHEILVIKNGHQKHLIPYVDQFVEKIDLKERQITLQVIEGMLNEN